MAFANVAAPVPYPTSNRLVDSHILYLPIVVELIPDAIVWNPKAVELSQFACVKLHIDVEALPLASVW